ncbi:serine hydrolase domain-containing protein [Brevibacterium zhoupengii]|uniref:serine hydrolase domain-containing protein n=1 Tax=Brevibacterium zhoupengii TaxID=2898795 RepID=UPI001E550C21|nr:serine hydrolase domain-containing protein [Brevibacterium zhoupengii]
MISITSSTARRIFSIAAALVLACSLAAMMSAAPANAAGNQGNDAEEFVSDYTSRHGLPGASYAMVKDGEVVTTGASGDVATDTPIAIGSVSKSFTAFAVLQLVDSGKVDLDAPITDYLPDFSIRGADASAITVRMLLSHTSGLPNPTFVASTGSLESSVALISDFDVASKPGSTYAYSNFNYRTLARMVEVVDGQDFDAYLDENIFTPLGMDDTTSEVTAADRPGLDAGHVTAYGLWLQVRELTADIGGSGGVISTAEDMAKWMGMQQRAGTTADGTRILSADLVEESHTPQPNAGTYGLGWQLTSTADPERVGHGGSLTRYTARQDLVPSSGCATVVLLDSFTPIRQHQYDISTGLIDISEGTDPDLGFPLATVVDLCLAALTLLALVLGIRGLLRSDRWARKRAQHPWWRRSLRLLPQAIMPIVAVSVFVGLTFGQANPATTLDIFGLWPAFMVLIATGGLVGVVLIVARLRAFGTHSRLLNAASSSVE